MTVARQVVPGRTYFMSRRCTQRQLLLRPDAGVRDIYLYCVAEAAARYGITLHAFVAMSNHQHIVFRDEKGNYPEFVAHLDKMIAKAMNARLGRWENFWASEQASVVYLVEPEDRFDKLVYLLANPVADHLVNRVSEWPGASSYEQNLSARTKIIERPRGYFRRHGPMPSKVELRLERPDGFAELSNEEWAVKVRRAVEAKEKLAREQRTLSGIPVLGRKAVLRALVTDVPKTVAPRRRLRPHVACLNRERRCRELAALVAFRQERRQALARLKLAAPGVLFPFGTYRIRGLFASAAPPQAFASR